MRKLLAVVAVMIVIVYLGYGDRQEICHSIGMSRIIKLIWDEICLDGCRICCQWCCHWCCYDRRMVSEEQN